MFELADCNKRLFKQIRQMAGFRVNKHPWKKMSDREIIRSAGLYKTDIASGKSGMTLAAVLLLGKDETIFAPFPTTKQTLSASGGKPGPL